MISTADVIELMALVSACHARTAPRMDDREVVLATASVWSELFNEHRFELPDLVAAVKQRARLISEAPEPADIIRVARQIRAERNQREELTELAARQDSWAEKAAEDVPVLTAAVLGGAPVKSTPRLDAARDALQTCQGKRESKAAIAEYVAALTDARNPKKRRAS